MKIKQLAVALAAALVLSACGGKPSNGNAKQALSTLLQQSGAGEVADIQNFEISGCTKADGMDGYRCDTRGTFIISVMGRTAPLPVNKNFRYAKVDGSWRAYAQ